MNIKKMWYAILEKQLTYGSVIPLWIKLRYYCMKCGNEHREIACPKCGSKMKRIGL